MSLSAEATDEAVRAAARDRHGEEGEVEVDDNAVVSRVDGGAGAYVQGWVWVDFEQGDGGGA